MSEQIKPPVWLSEIAQQQFQKLAPLINQKDQGQVGLLILLCDALGDYVDAVADVKANGNRIGQMINPSVQIKKIVGQRIERLFEKLDLTNSEEIESVFEDDKAKQ